MQDFLVVTAIVIQTLPIGEYDRRVVLFTKEKGKISAFVKGARRQNSCFMASTNLFCFGEFRLYAGRNSYNVVEVNISNYFEELRSDFEGAYYGMYFLEIADYYGRENSEDKELLKLLYQSLRALCVSSLGKELIRYIFEIKAIVIEGEFPGIPTQQKINESTTYAIEYIAASSIEKLFTFTVKEEILQELRGITKIYCKMIFDRKFKSLEILESII